MLPAARSHLATGILMSHVSRSSRVAAIALMLLSAAGSVDAQSTTASPTPPPDSSNHWEMLFSTGALVPTGVERQALKRAPLSTGQLSYVLASRVAFTTMFGWARSRDLLTEGNPRVSIFTYDVGVEARAPQHRVGNALSFTPFAGVGGGGRSFDHPGRDSDATHGPAGYAAIGGEMAIGRARVRLEARDYVMSMRPLVGGGTRAMRNDVSIIAGFRLVKKQPSTE